MRFSACERAAAGKSNRAIATMTRTNIASAPGYPSSECRVFGLRSQASRSTTNRGGWLLLIVVLDDPIYTGLPYPGEPVVRRNGTVDRDQEHILASVILKHPYVRERFPVSPSWRARRRRAQRGAHA